MREIGPVRFAGLVIAAILTFPAGAVTAAPTVLKCTAWGGSHTARYTFEVDAGGCSVVWREIDTRLDVAVCKPPYIEAVKPYAPAKGYILKFNLETGTFSDHVPGWADRGSCKVAPG